VEGARDVMSSVAKVALVCVIVLVVGRYVGTFERVVLALLDGRLLCAPCRAFTSTGNLNTPRTNATATALNAGQILIAGGSTISVRASTSLTNVGFC